ncbi:MAG TPA: TonB-dependent receptor [Steroidobacteraceae bacterium]|jgi:iron complex outermembrane receptor protein
MKTIVDRISRGTPALQSKLTVAIAVSLALGLLGAASAAQAQQAPATTASTADSGGLQEVVVTAQRRSQNVQNVPIAVTAFTADQLQSRDINDVQSIGRLSPGVNLDAGAPFSGDNSVLSASIRGIGQDDFAFNLNPGVGVYLDGVYLARTIGANQNLLDVERIEILKGPQGTLFGANTIGGAISIVTHTPGTEARVIAEATGGEFNRRDFSLTADIPLSSSLLSSISFSSQERDGYVKVIPYPAGSPYAAPFVVDPQTAYPKSGYQTADDYGGQGVQTVRGKVLWNASDKVNWTFTGDWSHENQTALPYKVLQTFGGNVNESTFSTLYNTCIGSNASTYEATLAAVGGPPVSKGPPGGLFVNICENPRAAVPGLSHGGAALLGAGYVGGPPGPFNYNNHPGGPYLGSNQPRLYFDYAATDTGNIDTTYANGPDFAKYDAFGGSATGVYDLNDGLQLKTITGYRQIDWNIGTDLDGTPETLAEVTDHQHQYQWSEELQLLGKSLDNKLNWVGGLYYFKEAGYVHDYVPFENIVFIYDFANDVQNKNLAAFIHADYNLTDNWGFTAGGRYTDVKAEFLGGQGDLNGFPVGLGPIRYFPNQPDSQSWHIFDPTFGVQYHFNSDVMAYLSWGKGFKAGGWTTRLHQPIASPTDARFSPEYSKTWELGLKSEWLNHHLLANAAVFYTDYDAIQLNIQTGISPVVENAGDAKIKGGELELEYLAGGFQLGASASYIDAYYTYVNPISGIPQYIAPDGTVHCPVGCDGTLPGVSSLDAKLPKTPKYKVSLTPEYNIPLPNDASLRLIGAWTYTAEMFNDALNSPQLRRPPTRNIDASIHYVSADNLYDLAVGGTNLTDDRYITAGSPNNGAGQVGGYYNPPREWYVSLRVKIGK